MAKPQPVFAIYRTDEWHDAFFLFGACLVAKVAFGLMLPIEALIYPASAFVVAGLYFFGVRQWPAAFLGLFLGNLLLQMPFPYAVMLPVAQVLQGIGAAYLLRHFDIDPLFRRYSDTFYVVGISVLVAPISPLIFALTPGADPQWSFSYLAATFSLIILTPFLLRWIAKPGFRRPPLEVAEVAAAFTLLVATAALRFVADVETLYSVRTSYFLLIPLFWIAIRLRPRFTTLAVVLISILTIRDTLEDATASTLLPSLFNVEIGLIVLAIAFYTVMALEEDVRVSKNVMRSQLGTLENAVSRISTESQAKNDFIAILAHELRNPLAPVVSSIEIMKMKPGRDADETETLEIMDSSMVTVRRLLDDLLDISRINEGKVTLEKQLIEINQVLKRAVVSTTHHFKERHQTLTWSGSRGSFFVEGDPVRLEQVFSNLLTNASKYSNSGDEVSIAIHPDDTHIEVRVIDEGFGIPRSSLDTIFKPFHQLERGVRSKKGLGIGLSLVQTFVEMHDGTVKAESEGENRGTTFSVRLPLAVAPEGLTSSDSSGGSVVESRAHRSRTQSKRTGPCVLVVDDNDAAAAGIGRLLQMSGCGVVYAYEGRRAIEEARDADFDVIILDIGLTDMEGYAVAEALRAEGYTGLLIALSGFSTSDAHERAMQAGFDHFLVKPAGYAELRQVIPGLK